MTPHGSSMATLLVQTHTSSFFGKGPHEEGRFFRPHVKEMPDIIKLFRHVRSVDRDSWLDGSLHFKVRGGWEEESFWNVEMDQSCQIFCKVFSFLCYN